MGLAYAWMAIFRGGAFGVCALAFEGVSFSRAGGPDPNSSSK